MTISDVPLRTVHHADARVWLAERGVLSGCSVVTSLPDVSELPHLGLDGWKAWFVDAAAQVLRATPDDALTIFFQSDIKKAGAWVDKGYLCSRAAEQVGVRTLFHKIVCRKPPGTATFGRPAYSHLLGFSRGLTLSPTAAIPDVLPDAGPSPWTRGMGVRACLLCCRLVKEQTQTRTVVDPYCGKGTVLAAANALGLSAIGVELSSKRARQAQALRIDALREAILSGGRHGPAEEP